jgi:uncharacterized protein (DUF427 family)
MTRAVLHGHVIAQSDDVKVVEGLTYFPMSSVRPDVLVDSPTTSRCFWKGKARYWHVADGNDDLTLDAAFAYENPWPLARRLVTARVGFWRDVEVCDD